jgi:pyruvate dehydrogenase E1 component alpha subunit
MTVELELTEEDHLKLYRQMVLIRTFEETCAQQYVKGKITGFTHLYSGEEAVAVGAMSAITDKDYVVTAYRDHGHALAKGASPRQVMSELFGKSTGLSRGRGGSMHLFHAGLHFMGGYAIVGGGLPITTGIGLAVKYRNEKEVVLSFFGDGAVNQGVFHESLNMAKLWTLPVVFICENNFYGIGTNVSRASAVDDLYQRTCSYRVRSLQVDGMDVLAVHKASVEAVDIAREDNGPVFIEAKTYRFRGHSMADPDEYRSKMERQIWRARDPIIQFAGHLNREGITNPEKLEQIQNEANEIVADAVDFAGKSPEPSVDTLFEDVYA